MKNKNFLIALATLLCISAQAVDKYPELTDNLDNIWRADIEELRNHFKYVKDDPFARYEIGKNLIYTPKKKIPASMDSIKKPAISRFVKMTDSIDADLINEFVPKIKADTTYYILKNRVNAIRDRKSIACEYVLRIIPYSEDNIYQNSIKKLKDFYLEYTSNNGFNVRLFLDRDNLQGFVKDKNGYDSGSIKVIIKGRVLSLSLFDCRKDQGKEQIIKDLTEWGELLIKAN